jgi:hypothetical protein
MKDIAMLLWEYRKTEAIVGDTYINLIFWVILVVILICCIAILVRNYKKLIARNNVLIESLDNLCQLNDKLRMDRHDYLNHLQIIYGLMELEEYDEMNSYLRKVYKELLKTGKAVKTSKPAINALLAAKMAGIHNVLVPEKNRPDVAELSEEITDGLAITYVSRMGEVIEQAFT